MIRNRICQTLDIEYRNIIWMRNVSEKNCRSNLVVRTHTLTGFRALDIEGPNPSGPTRLDQLV